MREMVLAGWPVQFLPAANALEEQALASAIDVEVDGVPTWVMTAEHLAAIALRIGRPKDHNRILQFLEQNVLDVPKLRRILDEHNLTKKWQQFERRYLGGAHDAG